MFNFEIADFVPYKNKAVLEKVRNMSGEELTHHPNPDFRVKIVDSPSMIWVSDMIARIESMVRMGQDLPIPVIRGQIASGIDIIVHLERDPLGRRIVG